MPGPAPPLRISTDAAEMDLDAIHAYLSEESYWARGIPRETVARSIANSLCFGVFDGGAQVAFARVITDRATFAYLADVYVLPAYRGRGISRWMMEAVFAHPELRGLRRWMLMTRTRTASTPASAFVRWSAPSARWSAPRVTSIIRADDSTGA